MAARTRRGTKDAPWDEKVRERIKAGMLVKRLSDHVLGKVEMTGTQVTAGLGLLKKAVPDLQAVQLQATTDNTLNVTIRKFGE